jgi:hypothetical protein
MRLPGYPAQEEEALRARVLEQLQQHVAVAVAAVCPADTRTVQLYTQLLQVPNTLALLGFRFRCWWRKEGGRRERTCSPAWRPSKPYARGGVWAGWARRVPWGATTRL